MANKTTIIPTKKTNKSGFGCRNLLDFSIHLVFELCFVIEKS